MKKFTGMLFLLATLQVNAQKPIFTNAKLNAATVFLTSAELAHTATVNLPKGTSEIVIKNVANSGNENSIRVAANKNVTILSAQFTNNYYSEYEIDESSTLVKMVRDSIELTTTDIRKTQNAIQTDQQTIQLLDKNQAIGGQNTGVSTAELIKLVEYYRAKRQEIANNIYTLQNKETKLTKTLNRLQNQLTTSETQQEKVSNGKIVLQVMSEIAQTIGFSVSYITPLARWSPMYEINAESISAPIQLISKGKVQQTTGIDWKQVKLTLSSTNPNQSNAIPMFSTWFLSYQQPYGNAYRNDKLEEVEIMNTKVSTKSVAKAEYADAKSASSYTTVSQQQLSMTYEIDLLYDIYSNGKPYTVELEKQSIPATFHYYAAPKLNKDVFLLADIANYSQYNLLAGEATIVFEGMFVGKTSINPSSTSDTLSIAMGVDKNVSIKREKVVDKSGAKVLSAYKENTFTYDITVRNNKKSAIQLVVKDQYPTSSDKDVIVELLESDKAAVNVEVGTLTWDVNLKPNETKKFRISYKVRYPKDKTIYNL